MYGEEKPKLPTIYSMSHAAEQAWQKILDYKEGRITLLKSRFKPLNDIINGGFTYSNVVLLGGASGHGKSYALQMIRADFLNLALNNPQKPFKILMFSFEMAMAVEMLRELTASTGIQYSDLVAYGEKNKLDERQMTLIQKYLRMAQKEDRVFIVNNVVNRHVIKQTVQTFKEEYPDHDLIVMLDHTLLVEQMGERDEIQLAADMGKMFIDLKLELGILGFLVGQLNTDIEDIRRREPGTQFPVKKDFHGSKQVFQAADLVMVIHRPELLNVEFYGRNPTETFPTKDLIAWHLMKTREGDSNQWLRFTQDFAHGTLREYTPQHMYNYNSM